ncbi:3974_t:CDS:2, partial [Funneliformis mosseae]
VREKRGVVRGKILNGIAKLNKRVRSSAANVSYQPPSQELQEGVMVNNTEVDKLKKVKNQLQTELKVKSTSKITIELLDEVSASEARAERKTYLKDKYLLNIVWIITKCLASDRKPYMKN